MTGYFNFMKNLMFSMDDRLFLVEAVWYCNGETTRIEFIESRTKRKYTRSGKIMEDLMKEGKLEYRGLFTERKPNPLPI